MPRTRGTRQTALSVSLLKSSVTINTALKNATGLNHYPVKDGATKIGDLYIAPVASSPPRWGRYIEPYVATFPNLANKTVSAVLLLPVQGRLFAVTFGYGWSLLAADAIEDSFGLRLTLGVVPDGGIRTISKKSLDAFAHHTHTQAIRAGRLPQFGVDLDRDLLQAVTGVPADDRLGLRLVGKDSLGVLTKATLPELPGLLGQYLTELAKKSYRKKYPEIDKITEEQDPAVIAALEAKLLREVVADEPDRLWLAVPEVIDWDAIVGFRYSQSGTDLYRDLHVAEFLKHVRDPASLSVDRLKQRRAFAIDGESDRPRRDWSVFKCLHFEVKHGRDDYVLSGGRWFRLNRNFVSSVDRFVEPLLAPNTLPVANGKEDEAKYNKRAAAALDGCALMDRATIGHGGGRSRIEFCDLFTKTRKMIHVKKYAGSGVLSHLFAQGANAAELLLFDEPFRQKVRKGLPPSHQSLVTATPPRASDFEVVFGIIGRPIGKKTLAQALPFFSRVTLRRVAQRLQGAGYRVSVAWIPNR